MMNFENLKLKKNAAFDVTCNCLPASISEYILVEHSLPLAAEALQGQQGAQVLPYLPTTLFPEIIFLEKQPPIPFFVLILLSCCRKIERKGFVASKPPSLSATPPVCVG